MTARSGSTLPMRTGLAVLGLILTLGIAQEGAAQALPRLTITGEIKTDGSVPPSGWLPDPDHPGKWLEVKTLYTIGPAYVDYTFQRGGFAGNPLSSEPSPFTGTTGGSPDPIWFSVSAQTFGKATLQGMGSTYVINPYFTPGVEISCPIGSTSCASPLDRTLHGLYGTAKGTIRMTDGTPVSGVYVYAAPSFVPPGAETHFVPRYVPTRDGVFDFSASALGPTREQHAKCFLPHHWYCEDVTFPITNNWGLRVLGDGTPGKLNKLWSSNSAGQFDWIISIPGAQPPAMARKEQTVTVKSSKAEIVSFVVEPWELEKLLKLPPWPDLNGRPEDNDGLEGDDEIDAENPPECGPHPVSLLTGNVYLDQADIVMPGLRHPFVFTRSYNSQGGVDGALGRGWTHNFEKRIEVRSYGLGVWAGGLPRLYTDPSGSGVLGRYGKRTSSKSTIVRTAEGFVRSFRTGGHEVYSPSGRLLRRVDRTGRATTLTYTGNVLTEVRSPEGRRLRFEDSGYSGLLKRIVGPEGVVAEFDYEEREGYRLLSRVRYPDGTGHQFTYSSGHLLETVADLQGTVLDRHGYDGDRAAWSELNAGRERRSYAYEPGQTVVTDERGLVSIFEWEKKLSSKYVTKITGCDYCGSSSGTRTWERDDEGRITRYTDADGNSKSYTWAGGAMGSVRDGAGRTTTYSNHDSYGRPGAIARTGFGTTTIGYAPEGPTQITRPTGQTTTILYVGQRVRRVTSGGGLTQEFDINDLGEVRAITDSRGQVTTFTHDGLGRPTGVTRPDGQISRFAYDIVGRPSSIERPDGKKILLGYDGSGRLISITDPAGKKTRISYDTYDRVESVLDPLGAITRLAYDVMSNPTSLTDAMNHQTSFGYDGIGRVTSVTDALGEEEEYEYLSSGRLRKRTDRRGIETTYTYDGAGRLRTKTFSDGTPPVVVTYEDAARRVTFQNGTDTVVTAFDLSGRLVSETSSFNGTTVSYSHNDDHQRETLRLDGDLVATYVYQQGYLDKIQFGAQQIGFHHDSLGRRDRLTYPNGLETRYSYLPTVGWLEKIKTLSGSTLLWEWAYGHDAVGNRTSKRSPDGLESYKYDAGDRLTQVDRSEGWTGRSAFTYDLVGNRLRQQADGLALTHRYDATNRLLESTTAGRLRVAGTTSEPANVTVQGQPATATSGQGFESEVPVQVGDNTLVVQATDPSGNTRTSTYRVPVSAGAATYSYDLDGNLTSKTDPTGTWTYEWNAENELRRILKDGAEVARFAYDPLGRRVEKVAGSTTARYAYDGMDILRETVTGGPSPGTFTYVHGPGIDEPLVRLQDSGPTNYYHADGLGSVVRITNQSGGVVHTYSYDAWGNIETGAARGGQAFTGREWDPETGLYYYRARYYDPRVGRFISQDPAGFLAGNNRYKYANGIPTTRRDPTGLWSPGAHDYLFSSGLRGYRDVTEVDLNTLAAASRAFDIRSQAGDLAHMHSMRSSEQDAAEALEMRDEFVARRMCLARGAAQAGNRRAALMLLAEAAHALQDSLSPLHMERTWPREWSTSALVKSILGLGHSPFEGWGKEDTSRLDTLTILKNMNRMQGAYDHVFPR